MDIGELNAKYQNCSCGMTHTCPLDFVRIGKGVLPELAGLCSEYKSIVLVADENTYEACGRQVQQILNDKVENCIVLAANGDVVIPNEEKIAEIEAVIGKNTDLIVGVGSGVINDLCKYVSFKCGLRYFIVATAPSMDGYASSGAALILEGMKITLNARPPRAIVADTDVLKSAPLEMLQAGYGDIIGKYSCLNDWKLSALINDEYFCQRVYDMTYNEADRVRGLAKQLVCRDEDAVKALMEALVTVGIAMSYVNTSRPASGSEHHLSHFFEITGILDGKTYLSHGIDVGYSSVVTAALRERIAASVPGRFAFNREEWLSDIKEIYSTSADGVTALQDKLGWYTKDDSEYVEGNWAKIADILKEAPSAAETKKMLEDVGLCFDEFEKVYGKEKIRNAIKYAKDLKDRYSVLWLNYGYFKIDR